MIEPTLQMTLTCRTYPPLGCSFPMGLFSRKSPKQKLEEAYRKKLEEAHKASQVNRTKGDQLLAEAEDILKKLEALG